MELNINLPWEQVKEKLKETNVELTDEDLAYAPGQEEDLFNRLGKKINMEPEHVKDWIESVASTKRIAS